MENSIILKYDAGLKCKVKEKLAANSGTQLNDFRKKCDFKNKRLQLYKAHVSVYFWHCVWIKIFDSKMI